MLCVQFVDDIFDCVVCRLVDAIELFEGEAGCQKVIEKCGEARRGAFKGQNMRTPHGAVKGVEVCVRHLAFAVMASEGSGQ